MATKIESSQARNLCEKLIAIQHELKAPKGQYNSFGKYKYRSCEDIIEAAKPLMFKERVALVLSDEALVVGNRFYIKATALLIDNDSGDTIQSSGWAREDEVKKGMDGSQITGTASSYARKYALNGLFAIDDTKDADTDEHAQERNARANKSESEPIPEPTQENEAPEPAFSDICSVCGQPIAFTDCGKFDATTIIENSNNKLGATFCLACGRKKVEEIKKKKGGSK